MAEIASPTHLSFWYMVLAIALGFAFAGTLAGVIAMIYAKITGTAAPA